MSLIKKTMSRPRILGTLALCGLFLSGCSVTPQALDVDTLNQQRTQDLARMFGQVEPIQHPLTLAEVVARSLRFNLDHRVKVVEEAQALDLSSLDKFELLPKLAASSAYSGRSNDSASNSRSMLTGQQSLEVSTSQEREHVTSDLDLTWNILDFGVSYFNARQNADRRLIAHERERKVIQNLMQESRSAYWRALAAQELQPRVHAAISRAESALKDAKKVEDSELRSPLESLRFRKSLLENLRQLESLAQEMATSKVDLSAMMTLPPGTTFVLEAPKGPLQVPEWSIPLERMEESALISQPDMREMAYQGRIVVDESRKSLLKLFPGITLSTSRKRDNNAYTMNKDWYETGVKVTWNLLGLLSAPDQLAYNKTNEEVIEIKRLAMRMALLAQVHVAWHQFDQAKVQLSRSNELFEVEKQIVRHTSNRTEHDAQSVLEQIASETSAILAEMRLYNALALSHNALGRMMATTGQDPDIGSIGEGKLEDLTGRVENWLGKQFPQMVTRSKPIPSAAAPATSVPVPATKALIPAATASDNPATTTTALATGQTGTVRSNTYTRSGPSKHHRKLRIISSGKTINVLAVSSDGYWSRIGDSEWVATELITTSTPPASTILGVGDRVTVATKTILRGGPGMQHARIRTPSPGENFVVMEISPDSQWLRVGDGEWIFSSLARRIP
ncbi:MAG: Outer rane protein [Magnetococcales bacterium]|nr:Outer rane protein [Magnetococcales bacterium]